MNVLAEQIRRGENEIKIIFSSPGGNVINGITLYNFIRSLPATITFHNIGLVDSVSNVIFLAGDNRYAVRNSSFLFHGVGFTISKPVRFEEKQLREKMLTIERDTGLLANIIAERTELTLEQIRELFLEAQTKNPEEAEEVGIIDEIRDVEIPANANIISLVF